MSKSQERKISNVVEKPNNIILGNSASPMLKKKDPFRTVGTVRLSKSGNSISIKLIAENRFIHISKKDIESILIDEHKKTVANVIEYASMEGN